MAKKSGAAGLRAAAVLVPVFTDAHGVLRLVLIRRTERGVHGGQIAFPGGKRDPGDASLLDTALREAREEIGLDPDRVRVIEALEPIETRSTRFTIAPFLGEIQPPERWTPDPSEVIEILEVSVAALADPLAHGESLERFAGERGPQSVPFIRIGDHRLWGATHRIVTPILPRLLAGEWRRPV